MSHLSEAELVNLEHQGELATWPQLERIKPSSKIGLALDSILVQLGGEELRHQARQVELEFLAMALQIFITITLMTTHKVS